ncbi:DUF2505 domain-containing protein [Rhodococcus rhodnii]|uniref:DUF2505 domain-containing protein n=2 Tax=Rhodococcus rhodnii TaxID=38312 RepID=R7WMY5_9NOCA|nr:DUF2505 domain-containing protein [Rhodococcus rhodnii]EOM76667.1 hypothetical protein Rrhod_1944 [Rhodococcus rhodnii LMG 5362]TXG91996.1 DUF2505 domain-containing protein [Rhodococcus rhodnii]
MSRRIEHSSSLKSAVTRVHAAFVDEQYWKDRIAEVGGPHAQLGSVETTGDRITVEFTQAIPEDQLPSLVTKIRAGDLVIARTETWEPLSGDTAKGTFTAGVEGAPARVGGTHTLAGSDGETTVTTDGEVEVSIPFLGGKIEAAIAEQLAELFRIESEFTAEWLAR